MKIERHGDEFTIQASSEELFELYTALRCWNEETGIADAPEVASFKEALRPHLSNQEKWNLIIEDSAWMDEHRAEFGQVIWDNP